MGLIIRSANININTINISVSRCLFSELIDVFFESLIVGPSYDQPRKKHRDIIANLIIKNEVYQNAKRLLEWETLILYENRYTVVRITLQDRQGKAIYEYSILLISNIKEDSE